MTPTEQENELRQKIQDIFNDCTSGWLITIKNFNGSEREPGDMESEIIGDILDLITADSKHVALEARIDELKRTYPQLQKHQGIYGQGNYYYDDRIAELKAQQEKL